MDLHNEKWTFEFRDGSGGSFELSIHRDEWARGLDSWGWGGWNKVVMFGSGHGQNAIAREKLSDAKAFVKRLIAAHHGLESSRTALTNAIAVLNRCASDTVTEGEVAAAITECEKALTLSDVSRVEGVVR